MSCAANPWVFREGSVLSERRVSGELVGGHPGHGVQTENRWTDNRANLRNMFCKQRWWNEGVSMKMWMVVVVRSGGGEKSQVDEKTDNNGRSRRRRRRGCTSDKGGGEMLFRNTANHCALFATPAVWGNGTCHLPLFTFSSSFYTVPPHVLNIQLAYALTRQPNRWLVWRNYSNLAGN